MRTQIHALTDPTTTTTSDTTTTTTITTTAVDKLLHQIHALKSRSLSSSSSSSRISISSSSSTLDVSRFLPLDPFPFPSLSPSLLDHHHHPSITPTLRPLDSVPTFSHLFRRIDSSSVLDRGGLYFEQCVLFRGIFDPKLFRKGLRFVMENAVDANMKVVAAAWLRYERREDELTGGFDPESVVCDRGDGDNYVRIDDGEECSNSEEVEVEEEFDMGFRVGEEEIRCVRYKMGMLSRPLKAMLYGEFVEAKRETIYFTKNGVSVEGMRALEMYSRKRNVACFDPCVVLELLSFGNKFCCDELKSDCDVYLAGLVDGIENAVVLMEYGLEETAYQLVAACLQVFLRELPGCLQNEKVMGYFCSSEAGKRLKIVGHCTFQLYYFLSQIAMEDDMKLNTTVMLLERLVECAVLNWQQQLGFHLLGCVMYERNEYKDAEKWFQLAADAGHVYSMVGVARCKYKRGHKYAAYKLINSLLVENPPTGWMYQERSLYCGGKEKITDLDKATELDPTLSFPYKYRAIQLAEEKMIGAAISEISKIIGFKVSPDCLELRAWLSILQEDYEGALRDVRAILTLEPDYMMFNGRLHAEQLVDSLCSHVQQWSQADCWMQLYDQWSSVDDIGSLAVVHHMLANDPGKSLLRFRQSLLLLRLNCQKAAMRSLRLARNCSTSDHERLVYEGWILYDTGHREEALAKAEESISIQRSFEAFFLKAYALADSDLDHESSSYIIQLLEEALRCPSDGLRKGQALNNLGSVYVDCEKLDLAADCYMNALNIKHTRAHQGLARVYHLKNQRRAAYDEMTKLIEKARNNASAYEKRSEYCDRDMAKKDLCMATQLNPLRTYPYRYRAAVLMDDHKEDEAIAELSRALAFKPDLQLLHLRAAFHESMGDIAATLRDCEAALCLDSTHADTLELYERARKRANKQQQ